MAEPWYRNAEHDPIHAVAADWFARLQDPDLSLDDTLSWQAWMSADERHAQAYRRIEDTWQRFRDMPQPPLSPADALTHDSYDASVAVSRWRAGTASRQPSNLRWAIAASVAVAGTIATALILWTPSERTASPSQVYETRVGENRTVTLSDGSSVALGGRTRVEVALSADSRRLKLSRGEAFFTVAKDPARPFSVQAGSATLTALGTAFNVRRGDRRVGVAVVEGRVLVAPRVPALQQLPLLRETVSSKRAPTSLDAGNQTTVDGSGIQSASRMTDGTLATAWQTGRLTFEREPLRDVLEDVNRYATRPIVVGEEAIGDLKITGTVLSDNIGGWVGSLESAFGLQADEEPARIVLRRSR